MKKLLLSSVATLLVTSSAIGFANSADAAAPTPDSNSFKKNLGEVQQTPLISSESENIISITPFANDQGGGGEVKFIYVDKYIKAQGYMNNTQLKSYVQHVKNRNNGMTVLAATMGWLSLNPIIGGTISTASVVASIFTNFDDISNKAAQGYGMGWVEMYSTGTQSLTIIPRRDFSKVKTLYVKN
ncbi:hypothetical protein [Lysinibacillus sp. SGAir0095]|uniref:hypothetical protein n=1 Tax=Lysinibacillus sp. SGAir0095 TaxID=2070463 RepID=UPI0010CD2452|nr:hypothetical protein [Lysinibacillus sp. SGAir0095]QCR32516.1 hypothetical protein C1N55_10160 [Lysinibacillus sp. SGAir0095]